MFRKLMLGIVLAPMVVSVVWAGGIEFDVAPTKVQVDPGVLAPFMWISPVAVDDAPPISLTWNSFELKETGAQIKGGARVELHITPFVSFDVNGHTRAVIGGVSGTIEAFGKAAWTVRQENFGSFFAFSIYLKDSGRLSFLIPVRLSPPVESDGESIHTQLLVTCVVNEKGTSLDCEPPRIAHLEALRAHSPKAPTTEVLIEQKILPLRNRGPMGMNLAPGANPKKPGDSTDPCCHNMYYSHCKCLQECPVGNCDTYCHYCTPAACGDCRDFFQCLDGCT